MRLDAAAQLAFPGGGMSARSLRREAMRGRLAVSRIAGKDFTTLAAIERMIELCRAAPSEPAYGSSPSVETPPDGSLKLPSGASATGPSSEVQAALNATLKALNAGLPNTPSPRARRRASATVTPLR